MIRSLYSGVSGLKNHQIRMDVVGNNIANVNTTGFKAARVNFQDALSQKISQNPVTGQNQVGTGVKVGNVMNIHTQGPLQNTGRDLDLAIQGDGFFQVQDNSGVNHFTREGTFYIDKNYYIVNSLGMKLCDSAGNPIQITGLGSNNYIGSISIKPDGTISASDDTGTSLTISGTGKVGLTAFPNPAGLKKEGQNLYADPGTTGEAGTAIMVAPGTSSTIQSGYLEMSNVDLTEEFTNMITTQRGYQANARVITVSDTLLEELIQLKR